MIDCVRAASAVLVFCISGFGADAAEFRSNEVPPSFHPFQTRVKAGLALPTDGSATLYDTGFIVPRLAQFGPLAAMGARYIGDFTGARASISKSVIPLLDVAYYVTPNWAVEATCCVSWHRFQGAGTLSGIQFPLARPWLILFPPSLLLQYHFTNFGAFQPYVGVGVNYTTMHFPVRTPLSFALPTPRILQGLTRGVVNLHEASASPSWGVVGQVGADHMFDDHWGVNVDVKYIRMEPKVHAWGSIALRGAGQRFGPVLVPVNVDLKINPIVISAGLTYRFGGDWGVPKLLPF